MQQQTLLAACLMAWIVGCGDPSSSELDAVLPIDPQSTLDLGKGVNSLSREARGDCVERKAPQTIGQSDARSIRMTIEKIESSQDLLEKLDFSAEANYGAMASGKASYAKSLKINDYSIYVLGRVKVTLNSEAMRDVKLKAADYALAGQNYAKFHERCGDEFVIGRTLGGEMFSVLEIKTHSREEKKKIEASIKGSYGAFSASAQFSKSLENVMTNNSTKLTLYQDGGTYANVDLSADKLIEKLVKFPETVTKQNAWPMTVTTVAYTTLALPDGVTPYQVLARQNILTDFERMQRDFTDYRNTIQYIQDNPSEFVNPDEDKLQRLKTAVSTKLRKITEGAARCYQVTESCQYDDSIGVPDRAQLPKQVEKVEVVGCMDEKSPNYTKKANKPGVCTFYLTAELDYGFEKKLPKDYETRMLHFDDAVKACKERFKNEELSIFFGKIKPKSVTCVYRPYVSIGGVGGGVTHQ